MSAQGQHGEAANSIMSREERGELAAILPRIRRDAEGARDQRLWGPGLTWHETLLMVRAIEEPEHRQAFDAICRARHERDRAVGAVLCMAFDGAITLSRAGELLGMSAVQIRAEANRLLAKETA